MPDGVAGLLTFDTTTPGAAGSGDGEGALLLDGADPATAVGRGPFAGEKAHALALGKWAGGTLAATAPAAASAKEAR